jgi:general secretion pathway protein E
MLRITSKLRQLILADTDLVKFGEAALSDGMRPLRISAAAQVARGVTTVAEVMTVLPPVE